MGREDCRVRGVELLERPLEGGVIDEEGGVLGRMRGTPDGSEERSMEDRDAHLLVDPEAPRELVRQHADLEPLLERDAACEVGGQRERREELGEPGPLHPPTLERSGSLRYDLAPVPSLS